MKIRYFKFLIALLTIVALCCSTFVSIAATTTKEIAVKITFAKTSYKLGSTIEATYKITGGSGTYTTILYDCYGYEGDTLVNYASGSLTKAKGTISFIPKIGDMAYIKISGFDSDNRFFNVKSADITLTGSTSVKPIKATIKFEETSYKLNSTVNATYKITGGSGTYTTILYDCYGYEGDTLVNYASGTLAKAKGTISFVPKIGDTAYIRISGFDSEDRFFNVKSDSITLTKTSTKIKISKAKVAKVKAQTYTGKNLKPTLTITYGGNTLVKGKDYTVTYKNNKEIGKATVTITGKGKYTGTKNAIFIINPKKVVLSSVSPGKKKLTVKWKKGSHVDGYEIEYSSNESFSSAKKISVNQAKTVKATISKLKDDQTYYVRIRGYKKVGSKKYYSEWSKPLNKKTK